MKTVAIPQPTVLVKMPGGIMRLYTYPDEKPSMPYNAGKLIVSKQPNSLCRFCIEKKDII